MNDGGAGAWSATHVKFISLPLLIYSSGLPKIFALETGNKCMLRKMLIKYDQ
jgi:hypothetical protein